MRVGKTKELIPASEMSGYEIMVVLMWELYVAIELEMGWW